jgi:hypothetical protein
MPMGASTSEISGREKSLGVADGSGRKTRVEVRLRLVERDALLVRTGS